ncbi:SAMP protein, partial [Chauna torquata]|nr:SAMP protein [Chauna torquata]
DLVNKVFVFPQETKDSYTDLARPHSLFSYATKAQDNEILLFKPKSSEYHFYVGGKFVTFRVPEGITMSEHACASWESAIGIAEFWLNGKPWPCKGLQKDYVVGAEAVIVLGQEQDISEGGFDALQSFMGETSDVYVWDRGLPTSEVQGATRNNPTATPTFGWRNFPYKTKGKVYLRF